MVKTSTALVGIWPFLWWRFSAAVVLLALIFPKKVFKSKGDVIRGGAVTGGFLFLAIWSQTMGLQYTTAGRSGFITSLYVPLTPLCAWIIWRQKITVLQTAVAVAAFFGLYILTLNTAGNHLTGWFDWLANMNRGDIWTLFTAFTCALHILSVEYYSRRIPDSINLGVWQYIWCAICSGGISFWTWSKAGNIWNVFTWPSEAYVGLFVTVVFSTCFGFTMQIVAQKTVSSLKAALIFALEAPFAVVFAYLFIGEKMGKQEAIGALIVFLTSIIPESWLIKSKKKHIVHANV